MEEPKNDRVHSILDILLEPHRLDHHIQSLKDKKERFPNEYDLIKAFLKEATKENQKEPVKKALIKLVIKVYSEFNINIEQIETHFSPKWQRQLLNEIVYVKGTESSIYELTKHRWIIRNLLKGTDPKLIFGTGTTKDSAAYSSKFLAEWLDRPHEAQESLLHIPIVTFEYGKYQYVFETKDLALKSLTRCKSLLKAPVTAAPHVAVDQKQLDDLIFDCRLATRQVSTAELLQHPSPLLRISGLLGTVTKTVAANGDARAQLESIVNILLRDNIAHQLPISYRVALEQNPLLSPIKSHITASNAILEALLSEHRVSVPTRFDLRSSEAIKALFQLTHTQLTLFELTEPKVTVQSREHLTAKLTDLALTVCTLSRSVQALDELYYLVPEFKGPQFDTLRATIQEQDEINNAQAIRAALAPKDPLAAVVLERDPNRLATLLHALDTHNLQRALTERVLAKKAQTALSEGRVSIAQLLFKYLSQASVRTSVVEWGHICATALAGTSVLSDISAATTPAEPLMLEIMLTHLINTSQWLDLKKYILNLNVNSTRLSPASVHTVNICKMIGDVISKLSEDTMQVEGELDPLADTVIELVQQLSRAGSDWTADSGVLSRLTEQAVRALSYVFLSALHASQPPANPRTYFPDRFVDPTKPWATIAFDEPTSQVLHSIERPLLRLTYSTVERLLVITELADRDPLHLHALLTSAELSLLLDEPRRAARQLLGLGVLETYHWSAQGSMPVFERALPVLILAFSALQEHAQAIVLCQCLAEVNYAVACKLIQDNFLHLQSEWFEYIWEIPLLELLIYIYSKLGEDKRANQALAVMGRPEFNEHNTAEARTKMINDTKRKFLRKLTRDLFVDSK